MTATVEILKCPICNEQLPDPKYVGRYVLTTWPDGELKHLFCATFLPEADDFLVRGDSA